MAEERDRKNKNGEGVVGRVADVADDVLDLGGAAVEAGGTLMGAIAEGTTSLAGTVGEAGGAALEGMGGCLGEGCAGCSLVIAGIMVPIALMGGWGLARLFV